MIDLSLLSLAYLRDRPWRTALVGASIALGVAVLLGVMVGTATIERGLDRFVRGSGDAEVVVTSAGPFGTPISTDDFRELAALPDAERTTALTASPLEVTKEHGIGSTPIAIGVDLDALDLVAGKPLTGRAPEGVSETAVSTALLDDLALELGDELMIAGGAGHSPRSLIVVGELSPGVVSMIGQFQDGHSLLVDQSVVPSDNPALALVDLVEGVEAPAWLDKHRNALPGLRFEDVSAARSPMEALFASINLGLASVSLLTMGLAAFLIHLAMSSAVERRTRDYGTLMAIGTSRSQITAVVVAEAALLAVVSTAAGLVLGLGLGRGLVVVIVGIFGFPVPELVVQPWSIAVAVAAGLGFSTVAALLPARRAASLTPVEAIADVREVGEARLTRATYAGITLLAAGLVLAVAGSSAVYNLATPLVLIGLPMALPAILSRLAAVLRPLAGRLSPGIGDVALEHLHRERHRSSLTAGLVTAVLTVTLLVGAGYSSFAPMMRAYMDAQFGSDIQLTTGTLGAGSQQLPADAVERVAGVAGVESVTPMWHAETTVAGDDRAHILTVIDTATHFGPAGYVMVEGDRQAVTDALGAGGSVLVNHSIAVAEGWEVGDRVPLVVGGRSVGLELAGTYAALGDDIARAFVIGRADGERLVGLGGPNEVRVDVADGTDPAAVAAAVIGDTGTPVEVRLGDDNVDRAMDQFNGVFSVFLAVMVLAGTVGLLGVANTMAITVLQRFREIGVLRSLGVHTGEIQRMVFFEATALVVIALLVAIPVSIPLVLGSGFAAGGDILGFPAEPRYPWGWLAPITVLTLAAALLASVLPARRAAHIDPIIAVRLTGS